MALPSSQTVARNAEIRARNVRLGLTLASIALVFFVSVILKYTLR